MICIDIKGKVDVCMMQDSPPTLLDDIGFFMEHT
jgi:hypothetical protein